jgi:tetratricopeptide (TPR) repeat protein
LRASHEPSAAELAILGWNDVIRRRGPADRARARDRFERALREDPDSIIALDGLGAVYLQDRSMGTALTAIQIADAERAIERALRLAPNDANTALLWGNLQMLNGRPDLAIPAIEKSNRITPAFANGHLLLGRALLSAGRIGEVQPEADRAAHLAALSGDSARLSAALDLGAEAALMQHDDNRALDLARRAIAERPTNGQAHAVLAAAEALAGHPEQAAAEMATGLRLWPGTTIKNFDLSRPSNEARYLAARERLYEGLRVAGMPAG